jgi:protein-serine/threonine kinase
MALAISTSTSLGDSKSSQFLSPSSFSLSSNARSTSFHEFSPLPSPHIKPKTSAFFSIPDMLPPPSPEPEHSKSKNSSFFSPPWSPSSSYGDLPEPSRLRLPRRSSSGSTSQSTPDVQLQEPSRSTTLNSGFFSPRTLPTPPPSSYSASTASTSSRDPSPAPRSPTKGRLLSRLFPSRYTAEAEIDREFVAIDQTPRPADIWTTEGTVTTSPLHDEFPSTLFERATRRIVSSPESPVKEKPLRRLPAMPRETIHVDPQEKPHLAAGETISSASGRRAFILIRELGQGAFSSVWLSRVVSTFHERTFSGPKEEHIAVEGTRPLCHPDKDLNDGEGEAETPAMEGQLVAMKMTDRKVFEINDRTRVSFIREVEVLKVGISTNFKGFRMLTCDLAHITSIYRVLHSIIHHANTSLPGTRARRWRRAF